MSDELTDGVEAVIDAQLALTQALRRAISELVMARPSLADLRLATDRANALADALEAVPDRRAPWTADVADDPLSRRLGFLPMGGNANPIAPPVPIVVVEDPDGTTKINAELAFGRAYEGPSGQCHGGIIAAVYDEMLGHAQRGAGQTASLTIDYRGPTPLGRTVAFRAWLDRTDGRKRFAKGTCHLDGVLISEAQGLFIVPRGASGVTLSPLAPVT